MGPTPEPFRRPNSSRGKTFTDVAIRIDQHSGAQMIQPKQALL